MKAQKKPPTWPDEIYDVFKQVNIRQVAYVPDAGHTRLINRCHADKSADWAKLVISIQEAFDGVRTRISAGPGIRLLVSPGRGRELES